MKISWIVGIAVAGVVLSPVMACADTRYVSDQLVITLREGMGNQYRVSKTLPTDTPVEVLSEHGNYLHVRLDDGSEGYVLTQYISKKLPKNSVIQQLTAELETLRARVTDQEQARSALENDSARWQQQLAEAQQSLQLSNELLETTRTELAELQVKAENVLLIDEERQRLKKALATAEQTLERLRQENAAMLKTAMIKWFVAGGGVLFLGWVAGKFSIRKKRGLGSF